MPADIQMLTVLLKMRSLHHQLYQWSGGQLARTYMCMYTHSELVINIHIHLYVRSYQSHYPYILRMYTVETVSMGT